MTTGAEAIKSLCQAWLDATALPEGGFAMGADSERLRLLSNGVKFHELDHDAMRASCLGLSTVLLMPGLNTVIDRDHQWFWAWCGELLCGSGADYFGKEDYDLSQLTGQCIRAALATLYPPVADREAWEQQRDSVTTVETNAREWVNHSQSALGYLAFPLLEGITKRHCSSYVSMDGTVVQHFEVARGTGKPRKYEPGATCSSLQDLLALLRDKVASDELRADLDEQAVHLAAFSQTGGSGFRVLHGWRNDSLHGSASLTTIGGTVLNTALLISLSYLRETYAERRESAISRVRWELQRGSPHRSPWSYYPPYL